LTISIGRSNKNKPLPAATENGKIKESPPTAIDRDSESNQFKKPAKNHEMVICHYTIP
jgi:hypothetical protein